MSEIKKDIVGKVIEGYKVVKPLGQGKFSTVYQAERQQDQKLVALKIIKVQSYIKIDIRYDGSKTARKMFTRGETSSSIFK
jgi:serine/threonine protein kinase